MFQLTPLPYAYDALQPTIGERTMRTHHDKHHQAYVDAVNALVQESGRGQDTLEDIVRNSDGKLFNNAAPAWNHGFCWDGMTPRNAAPSGELASAIEAAFGGLAGLKEKFVTEGVAHFGSGWAWLVAEKGELTVITTHDAVNPLTRAGVTPLLVCDLWEHAYYLDYKNLRKDYLDGWIASLANWAFAAQQYAASTGKAQAWRYPAPQAATAAA